MQEAEVWNPSRLCSNKSKPIVTLDIEFTINNLADADYVFLLRSDGENTEPIAVTSQQGASRIEAAMETETVHQLPRPMIILTMFSNVIPVLSSSHTITDTSCLG
ncbi:MAG: hypothetical protein ACLFR1_12500 [Spirochaetia bacterium]